MSTAEAAALTPDARIPATAEERVERIGALLHAIFSTINGDPRADDVGNVDAVGWLTQIARDELRALQLGLLEGEAMDLNCGI